MSLIRDYFEKTKKHVEEYGELTIVLMQVGSFFEVYGLKDSNKNVLSNYLLDFSKFCDLAMGDKTTYIDTNCVVMAGFKDHLIDKYIKKLKEAGYTIVVYEQDEQCPNTTRSLTGIYSSGTYFSVDTETITNHTCCVWINYKKGTLKNKDKMYVYVGASVIDIFTGTTSILEYKEQYIKNPTTFDELERFISIYNPSETILISNLPLNETDDVINYANIKSKIIHRVDLNDYLHGHINIQRALNCEKQTYQHELLHKFYKITDTDSFMGIFNENVYATQSFCYLLDFIYQHNPNLVYKIAEPILENDSKKLILANHSLKQLNIIEDDNFSGKYSCVVKMLNECITPMGKRKFTYNFLNPITDKTFLQEEYDITENMLETHWFYKHNVAKSVLFYMKDITKIMRQVMIQKATPKYIYQMYDTINGAKTLYNLAIKNIKLTEYLSKRIPNFISLEEHMTQIMNYIHKTLLIDECKDIDNIQKIDSSFIQEGVSTELDEQIKTIADSHDRLEWCRTYLNDVIFKYESKNKPKTTKAIFQKQIDNSLEELCSSVPISNSEFNTNVDNDAKSYIKIYATEKNNYSLLATDRRCKLIEEALKNKKTVDLKYKSSHSGIETTFTMSLDDLEFTKQSASNKSISNQQINTLCKNINVLKTTFIETVTNTYASIIKELQNYQDNVHYICEFIIYIDLLYAKTFIANKYNYCKPEIKVNAENSEKSFVEAEDLRHCLIEKIQQTELYVGNNISLGQNSNNGQDGILLYGTNAVGKTSFIRALGISIVMAQSGLYVPASSFKFSPYKYIFTRILGNDNLFKGLSTFAVEMSELRTILRLADKNSLVLGDELCSGTESISAVSIFVAGIQNLAKKHCSFIFATHLHEIINYDEITSLNNVRLKHMSVIYDKEKDCLVYNRKLQDGPGNNMYGLEVCKSLSLPQDFLENAHNIRMKYHPETSSVLAQKGSHFNAKHIVGGICENCKLSPAVDVHHMIYQNEADNNGTIKQKGLIFNKNNKANLLNLCEKCHDDIHKSNKKYKKTKATIGMILEEVKE